MELVAIFSYECQTYLCAGTVLTTPAFLPNQGLLKLNSISPFSSLKPQFPGGLGSAHLGFGSFLVLNISSVFKFVCLMTDVKNLK